MWFEIASKLSFALLCFGSLIGLLAFLDSTWDDKRKQYRDLQDTIDQYEEEVPFIR